MPASRLPEHVAALDADVHDVDPGSGFALECRSRRATPASLHVVLAEDHAQLGELTERLIASLGLTGVATAEERDRAAEAGMIELREKPMFLEDLAELLDGS
jgi:hypothetical protein